MCAPANVYFTTNKLPKHWYAKEVLEKKDITALYRRIDRIVVYADDGSYEEIIDHSKSDVLHIVYDWLVNTIDLF